MFPSNQSNQTNSKQKQNFTPFNWVTDKNKTQQQLFSKAFRYCTQHLGLSNDLFTGEMEMFGEYKSAINLSGGMQWHNPTYSLVLNIAHNLQPEQLDQYILLYHGVKNNSYFKQIFKTRLKPGPGQAYRGSKAKNPKITVPQGVYGSQFLNVTMGYVDHSFPMVIQFATPQGVMTRDKNIFVVKQGTTITPIKLVFPFQGVQRNDTFQ